MLNRILKEVKVPFPDDFFPEITVSTELSNDLHRTASQLLNQTLKQESSRTRCHPNEEPDQWKLIGDYNGLQLYRERTFTKGDAIKVNVLGQITGTLENVLLALYASTNGALKTQRAIMHNAYLDAAVLQVLEKDPYSEHDTSFSYQFEGIKWLASAPMGKLMHKRDLCWHEQLGRTQDAHGNEVGYLVMQSVQVDGCPPFEKQGLIRSTAAVCYIFRPLPNKCVRVYMMGKHAVGGKSRIGWSTDLIMVELWLGVANALECVNAKRLSKLVSGKDMLIISGQSKTCDTCDSKLKMLKTNQNCKICGKSVCKYCRMTKMIYPSRNTGNFPCSYFFCKPCLSDAKEKLYGRSAASVSFHSQDSLVRSGSNRSGLLKRTDVQMTGQLGLSIMPLSSDPTPARRQGVQSPDRIGSATIPPVTGIVAYPSSPCRSTSSYSSAQTAVSSAPSMPHYSMPSMNPGVISDGPRSMKAYQLPTGRFSVRPVDSRAVEGSSRVQHTTSNCMRRNAPPRVYDDSHLLGYHDVVLLGNKSPSGSEDMDKQYSVGENEVHRHRHISDDSDMIEESSDEEDAHVTIFRNGRKNHTSIDGVAEGEEIEIIRLSNFGRDSLSKPEPVQLFEKDRRNHFHFNDTAVSSTGDVTTSLDGLTEQEKLMERLMQINMTAEATYLMAKYNSNIHGNFAR
ncbi:unnamed protein product [Peronospora belbahrii]|uniref:FYVE-type domain-containing protein n=1 Tax=Peronospora belbahrii TaxID=622444 RepID=A0AAU9KHJ4_9STRA|nr:unnamed protein product [Peronospora belbahrii]